MERDDGDIVRSVLAGSGDDFALLRERYDAEAQRWAFHHVRDIVEAEEIAQDALVEAFCKLGELREAGKFGGWLRGIVDNMAVSQLRRRRRTVAVEEINVSMVDGKWASRYNCYEVPAPEDIAAEEARRNRLNEAIGRLVPRYQRTVRMFYYEDQSQDAIAVEMGISVAAVKSLLFRARKILREEMKEHE